MTQYHSNAGQVHFSAHKRIFHAKRVFAQRHPGAIEQACSNAFLLSLQSGCKAQYKTKGIKVCSIVGVKAALKELACTKTCSFVVVQGMGSRAIRSEAHGSKHNSLFETWLTAVDLAPSRSFLKIAPIQTRQHLHLCWSVAPTKIYPEHLPSGCG